MPTAQGGQSEAVRGSAGVHGRDEAAGTATDDMLIEEETAGDKATERGTAVTSRGDPLSQVEASTGQQKKQGEAGAPEGGALPDGSASRASKDATRSSTAPSLSRTPSLHKPATSQQAKKQAKKAAVPNEQAPPSGPRPWQPWSLDNPYFVARGGLRVHCPVELPNGPAYVGELPEQQQLEIFAEILERDKMQGHDNWTLQGLAPSDLSPLAAGIELASLRKGDGASIQPIKTSALNRLVASGQVSSLTYYDYDIGVYAKNATVAEAFLDFIDGFLYRTQAFAFKLTDYFLEWLKRLRAYRNRGGWSSGWCRLEEYTGESNGFDHLPEDGGKPYFRSAHHFIGANAKPKSLHQFQLKIIANFQQLYPNDIYVQLVLTGTASQLDKSNPLETIKLSEALKAAARETSVARGGGNVISGGLINVASDSISRLSGLPPDTTLDSVSDDALPYGMRLVIARKHGAKVKIGAVLDSYRDRAASEIDEAEDGVEADNAADAGSPAEAKERKKSLHKPRFRPIKNARSLPRSTPSGATMRKEASNSSATEPASPAVSPTSASTTGSAPVSTEGSSAAAGEQLKSSEDKKAASLPAPGSEASSSRTPATEAASFAPPASSPAGAAASTAPPATAPPAAAPPASTPPDVRTSRQPAQKPTPAAKIKRVAPPAPPASAPALKASSSRGDQHERDEEHDTATSLRRSTRLSKQKSASSLTKTRVVQAECTSEDEDEEAAMSEDSGFGGVDDAEEGKGGKKIELIVPRKKAKDSVEGMRHLLGAGHAVGISRRHDDFRASLPGRDGQLDITLRRDAISSKQGIRFRVSPSFDLEVDVCPEYEKRGGWRDFDEDEWEQQELDSILSSSWQLAVRLYAAKVIAGVMKEWPSESYDFAPPGIRNAAISLIQNTPAPLSRADRRNVNVAAVQSGKFELHMNSMIYTPMIDKREWRADNSVLKGALAQQDRHSVTAVDNDFEIVNRRGRTVLISSIVGRERADNLVAWYEWVCTLELLKVKNHASSRLCLLPLSLETPHTYTCARESNGTNLP
ncbi:hypothetical protein JCM10296v2_002286 [Rhodotorula toruloides]